MVRRLNQSGGYTFTVTVLTDIQSLFNLYSSEGLEARGMEVFTHVLAKSVLTSDVPASENQGQIWR